MFKVLLALIISVFSMNASAEYLNLKEFTKLSNKITVRTDDRRIIKGVDLFAKISTNEIIFRGWQASQEIRLTPKALATSEYYTSDRMFKFIKDMLAFDGYEILIDCQTVQGSTEIDFCNVINIQTHIAKSSETK